MNKKALIKEVKDSYLIGLSDNTGGINSYVSLDV